MFSESSVPIGDFNGFDSRGLIERTNLALLHTEPTRGTVLDKNFTSDRSLIDRQLETLIPVVNTDHLALSFSIYCKKSWHAFRTFRDDREDKRVRYSVLLR